MWDLILWPGTEPIPTSLGVQSLNHWTARKPHYPTIHLCLWRVSLSAVVARKLKDKRILSRYGGLPASLPLTFRNPDTNFMACIVLLKSCLTPLERTEVHGAWVLCHTTSASALCWLCPSSPTGREPQLREVGDCSLTLSTATKLRKRLTQPQRLSVGTGAHLSQQYNKGVPLWRCILGSICIPKADISTTVSFSLPTQYFTRNIRWETQSPRNSEGSVIPLTCTFKLRNHFSCVKQPCAQR